MSNNQEITINSTPIKPQRESGLELFRIITMLLIVAHHYVVNSGFISYLRLSKLSFKSIFFYSVGAFGKIGINCFVLITGYFMCSSKITLKKFLKLFIEVMFYKIVITLIFVIFEPDQWTYKSIIKAMLPITSISDNFTGCYLIFFFFIPFLNILIDGLNSKQHFLLLLLCFAVFSAFPNIPIFYVNINYVMWFMIMYLLGAYIRKYNKELFARRKLWIVVCLVSFILCIISIIACLFVENKFGIDIGVYFFVADSNKILAVITAVSSFITFKNLNLRYIKSINIISSATFGVLLIHANGDAMRNWLWGDVLNNTYYIQTNQAYLHVIISVLLVYIVCTAIDLLRIYLLEKPFFKWLDNKFLKKEK